MSQGLGRLWDRRYARDNAHQHQVDAPAFHVAARFLDVPEVVDVEDWGGGLGHFRPYLAPHQRYIGVDGSEWSMADKIVDLLDYESAVDAVHTRGVFEHNLSWASILEAALDSFTQRAVLTFYEPFVDEYSITRADPFIVQRFTQEQVEKVIRSGYDGPLVIFRTSRPKGLPGDETLYCLDRSR